MYRNAFVISQSPPLWGAGLGAFPMSSIREGNDKTKSSTTVEAGICALHENGASARNHAIVLSIFAVPFTAFVATARRNLNPRRIGKIFSERYWLFSIQKLRRAASSARDGVNKPMFSTLVEPACCEAYAYLLIAVAKVTRLFSFTASLTPNFSFCGNRLPKSSHQRLNGKIFSGRYRRFQNKSADFGLYTAKAMNTTLALLGKNDFE